MDNTILQQGRFTTANTANQTIQIRSEIDWIKTYNLTQIAAGGAGALQCYWQLGMPQGQGIAFGNSAATTLTQLAAGTGFTLVDSSLQTTGAPVALTTSATGTSNATSPVVLTGTTTGLAVGSIIRLSGVATATQLNGVDFQISAVNPGVSFTIRGPFATAMVAGVTVAATSKYRIIPFDPIFYPRRRFIVDISKAASAVVTTSVDHGYTVGQEVRFATDPLNGMVEINGLSGTITAVGSPSTFTVNIDSTSFTTFTFPVTANPGAYTPAQVIPFGEDTANALNNNTNILADATINTGFTGVVLAYGAGSPAGVNNDVIYWVAGQSFSVSNS
jgi:hypothetical protein